MPIYAHIYKKNMYIYDRLNKEIYRMLKIDIVIT